MAAAGATAAAAAIGKKKQPSALRGIFTSALGFGIGWGAYSLIEQYDLLDEKYVRATHLFNLRTQRFLYNYVPASVAAKCFLPQEDLDGVIKLLESFHSDMSQEAEQHDQRVPFTKILSECRPQEQLEWLSDHIQEDIPYFFIADIFHSWAQLHESCFYAPVSAPYQRDHIFDSKVLCEGVWNKMLQEVIPFDVGVRTLCVLAVKGVKNAHYINVLCQKGGSTSEPTTTSTTLPAAGAVLSLHAQYHGKLRDEGTPKGNVVPVEVVDAAVATLLFELNRTEVHGRRFPWIGRHASGPYPLLLKYKDAWCSQVGSLVTNAALMSQMAKGAEVEVAAREWLKCRT